MQDFRAFYSNKRVFVTGHTGFKGAWLCEWLLSMGAKVSGYSIDIPTQPSLFEILNLESRTESILGDVADPKQLESVLQKVKPEIVFHLAAQPLVRTSYDLPIRTFMTNVMGTAQLLDSLRQLSCVKATVIVTSDKVYENTGQLYGYRESDHLGGKDPYSASKACAEIVTRSFIASFFSSAHTPAIGIARAGNVIGGGDWAKDRILADCIRSWSENKSVQIRSPLSVRPWQHVLEPLGGYLLLGEALVREPEKFHSEPFNFGPGLSSCLTVEEIVRLASSFWPGSTWEIENQKDNSKHEAHFLQVNCDKAHHLLKWGPRLSSSLAFQWTVEWYRRFREDKDSVRAITTSQIKEFETLLFSK